MSTLYTTIASAVLASLIVAAQDFSPSSLWRVSLHEADGVELDFRMTFAASGTRWEAFSRQGAAREMVGAGTAALGRLFGKMPPKEALVYIGDGVIEGEGPARRLTGVLESPFLGRRAFAGTITDGRLRADLTRIPAGTRAGTMEAVRETHDMPLRDYAALASGLERAIRSNVYDPAVVARPEFERFFAALRSRLAAARDDLDAVAAFQALKASLPLSHFDFIRNPRLAARRLEEVIAGDPSVDPSSHVRLTLPAPGVAFLRITRWDRVTAAVASAFERIAGAKPQILILDIRGNRGGDASSIAPFTHLVRERTTIGTFFGRKWFDAHRGAPTPHARAGIRTLGSDAAPAQLILDLREHGAVTGEALPREPHFAGTVYLLVDRGTASASEPLAHALKIARRATIIGERTAGAMLTALPHALQDGWVVTIPEADFVAADGTRLEGNGVEPHVKTHPNDVFFAVADRIERPLPFSAAMLRGGSHEALKRSDDAERAYRAALDFVTKQTPPPSLASRAAVHRRLANLRKARGDLAGALREYRELLKLVPDDAEALAAVRGG